MAEYHVGCGIAAIYAGRLNKSKTEWLDKSDVTDEATSAVAMYFLENHRQMHFEYDGEWYTISVTKKRKQADETS